MIIKMSKIKSLRKFLKKRISEEYFQEVKKTCIKCNFDRVKKITRQLRASDEPESIIYICLKCNLRFSE